MKKKKKGGGGGEKLGVGFGHCVKFKAHSDQNIEGNVIHENQNARAWGKGGKVKSS